MKKIVISFIAGALFATTSTVFADKISNIGKKITSEYTVKLDGEELPVKAVAFEGTSYAPVRAISEALGLDVDFINKEVILTTLSEEGGQVVDDTITRQQYDRILSDLVDDRNITILNLSSTISIIMNHNSGAYRLTASELEKQQGLKTKYETQVSEIDKQIADLKASYPEYAESSK